MSTSWRLLLVTRQSVGDPRTAIPGAARPCTVYFGVVLIVPDNSGVPLLDSSVIAGLLLVPCGYDDKEEYAGVSVDVGERPRHYPSMPPPRIRIRHILILGTVPVCIAAKRQLIIVWPCRRCHPHPRCHTNQCQHTPSFLALYQVSVSLVDCRLHAVISS